jgi:hypothetical protein
MLLHLFQSVCVKLKYKVNNIIYKIQFKEEFFVQNR